MFIVAFMIDHEEKNKIKEQKAELEKQLAVLEATRAMEKSYVE